VGSVRQHEREIHCEPELRDNVRRLDRRALLRAALAAPFLGRLFCAFSAQPAQTVRRARPSDPSWPAQHEWDTLNRAVGGRLSRIESPLAACVTAPDSGDCAEFFKQLKNPYFISDSPALTQASGWIDAWTSQPSAYVVAAANANDVAAAVNFARNRHLRLVVKGGGHSYLGTSSAPDSLLIWTRAMHTITLHDSFVAEGCAAREEAHPAVTVEAGALWGHAYDAVTTRAGRYVQGGGCMSVGVAGLVQSGGFGSFSKNFGTAAAALVQAEVVTADAVVRIANACINPELFWGLKGGGGGSLVRCGH
jgi:hypothetical protein